MEKKKYVEYGSCCAGTCGASKDITGCRFSISPMTDRYADVILGALSKAATNNFRAYSGDDCCGKYIYGNGNSWG